MLRPRRRLLTGGCAAARVEQGSHPHPHSADDALLNPGPSDSLQTIYQIGILLPFLRGPKTSLKE